MEFGDYCVIEQKRYGAENEFYTYKVISSGKANYYREVPVDGAAPHNKRSNEMIDIVKVICCGVCEEKVETFRLIDVNQILK